MEAVLLHHIAPDHPPSGLNNNIFSNINLLVVVFVKKIIILLTNLVLHFLRLQP